MEHGALDSQPSFLLPPRGKYIAQFIVQEISSSTKKFILGQFNEIFGRINTSIKINSDHQATQL